MTYSICVRESYGSGDESHRRFGVAVATRVPGVGALCPFVSENAAIATQSLTNVDLGRRGLRYVDEGLAVEDALRGVLNADDGAAHRQLHGVGADGTFAFSGPACRGWAGHREGSNYTVAGNMLVGPAVLEATADAYAASDRSEPLAKRLIEALAAGESEGGDRREELTIGSAAVTVATTEEYAHAPFTHDLRVDATETPIPDLRETYELAAKGYVDAMARYREAYEADSLDEL